MFRPKDFSHLVKKQVEGKDGRMHTVYVDPNKDGRTPREKAVDDRKASAKKFSGGIQETEKDKKHKQETIARHLQMEADLKNQRKTGFSPPPKPGHIMRVYASGKANIGGMIGRVMEVRDNEATVQLPSGSYHTFPLQSLQVAKSELFYTQILKSGHFGKKDAEIGEIHNWGDGPHVKTADGWKPVTEEHDGKTKGPFGPVYYRFWHKPKEAIEHLLKVKDGEAVGAIYKEGIGDIDFVWGKEGDPDKDYKGGYGFAHIIGKHGNDVLNRLKETIETGIIQPDKKKQDRIVIYSEKKNVKLIVSATKNKKWILTGFLISKKRALRKSVNAPEIDRVASSSSSKAGFLTHGPHSDNTEDLKESQVEKSLFYKIGLWQERTCACEGLSEVPEEASWTKQYLTEMVP